MPTSSAKKRIIFRLNGAYSSILHAELLFKLKPLLNTLRRYQFAVEVRNQIDIVNTRPSDVNIWIATNNSKRPVGHGYHILWFAEKMEPLRRVCYNSYDAVMSGSTVHAAFLRSLLPDTPVYWLPMPLDLSQTPFTPPNKNVDKTFVSVISGNIAKSIPPEFQSWYSKMDEAGNLYELDSYHLLSNEMQLHEELNKHFSQAAAYWDWENDKACYTGFLNFWPIQALRSGRRVVSYERLHLPRELDQFIKVMPNKPMAAEDISTSDVAPLTLHEQRTVSDYLEKYHDCEKVAKSLKAIIVSTLDQSDQMAGPSEQSTPKRPHISICEIDELTEALSKNSPLPKFLSYEDLESLIANGQRPHLNLVYFPIRFKYDHQLSPSLSALHQAVRPRLKVLTYIARNLSRFSSIECHDAKVLLSSKDWLLGKQTEIHEYLYFLDNLQKMIFTKAIDLKLLQDVEDYLRISNTDIKDNPKNSDLPFPWNDIRSHMVNREKNAETISYYLNASQQLLHIREICSQLHFPDTSSASTQLKLERPLGVFIHAFHTEVLDSILLHLRNIQIPLVLYISTDTASKKDQIERMLFDRDMTAKEIRIVPNRGRDVFPKLFAFATEHTQHDLVLHLHTKQSAHHAELSDWCRDAIERLIGSETCIARILAQFVNDQSLDIIYPLPPLGIQQGMRWIRNFRIAQFLTQDLQYSLPNPNELFEFPAGMMFWARTECIQKIQMLDLNESDFPKEYGQLDGTLAHTLERLLGLQARKIRCV